MTFVVIRWTQFASTLLLFGLAAFVRYGIDPDEAAQPFLRRARRGLVALAAVALVSAVAWWGYEAAAMSGRASGAWNPATLGAIASETAFGHVWVARLGLAALALALVAGSARRSGPSASWAAILCAGALLVTLAGTGHAASEAGLGGLVRRLEDGVHLASAGLWSGGLLGLGIVLRCAATRTLPARSVRVAATRFSAASLPLVACVAATGVLDALALVGRWSALAQTPYGRLLCAKIALFCLALGIAAVNRFVLVRGLRGPDPVPPERTPLRRTVWLELVLVQGAIVAVSIFGTLPPPTDLPPV